MKVFERAAEAGGQLLRVDRLTSPGDGKTPVAMLLTFDVGRILLSADPDHDRLDAAAIPEAESVPGGLEDASEDEPWWRLLGCALVEAEAATPDRLRLAFRLSGGRVRTVIFERRGAGLHAETREDG
jgi:hypothetical protein